MLGWGQVGAEVCRVQLGGVAFGLPHVGPLVT